MKMNTAEFAHRLRLIATNVERGAPEGDVEAALEQLATDVATDARWPAEPPVGAVLRFRRIFASEYTYVALRVENGHAAHWYLSATARDQRVITWQELRQLIGPSAPCDIAMSWHVVPVVDTSTLDKDTDVTAWVARHLADHGDAAGTTS